MEGHAKFTSEITIFANLRAVRRASPTKIMLQDYDTFQIILTRLI